VLERIQHTGNIFWAWSDRNWLLNGANVHVSMIAFDAGNKPLAQGSDTEPGAPSSSTVLSSERVGYAHHLRTVFLDEPQTLDPARPNLLNGEPVVSINPDLTSGTNTTTAIRLKENQGICFMGTTKVGAFDIDADIARKMLAAPLNPNGRPNSDVVRPWVNASDITGRNRGMYIIDFGATMSHQEAALYEMPFEYLAHHVQAKRTDNNRSAYADKWWLHGEPRPDLRAALVGLNRYIATPSVAKHRLFLWLSVDVVPDHAAFVFAHDDDYFFGVLHSSAHEIWARQMGTQLREVESGFRYTPKSTFDTFPFPWPPNNEPKDSPAEEAKVEAISAAARNLVQLRDAWLNPPDISEAELKKRTLTNLYNQRPTWLADAHRTLDEAVFAAYGWPSTLTTPEILARLLALNHQRAASTDPKK
jgi:type II restriction/modification system DNA methylase subunit YeeA